MRSPDTCRLGAPCAFLAATILFSACSTELEPRPDVVLVVVDTLRADRLSIYGCPLNTAPFLEELARRSLVFDRAWSTSSWTLPATVSLLTSVHPWQHQVNSLTGLELGPDEQPVPVNCIPAQIETLAETLRNAGYRTFGVVSNVLVGTEVDFNRGFDRFVKLDDEDADAANAVVASWREELLDDEPYFLYVHYFDPHDVLHARAPWFDPSRSERESGWLAELPPRAPDTYTELDWLATRLDPGPEWLAGRRASELSTRELHRLMAWIRAAYDSEIGFVDARIRALFEMVDARDAIVVFTADHGEEFYEHGDLTHGQNLYAETMRVPLLLCLPGMDAPRGRVTANVSTLDLVPTLRGLLRLPPSEQDQGQDLLATGTRRPVVGALVSKSGQNAREKDLRSITRGDWRLIAEEGGRVELYELSTDPLERVDVSDLHRELVTELLLELERIELGAPPYFATKRVPEPASEAMREHLRGVGYLGDD